MYENTPESVLKYQYNFVRERINFLCYLHVGLKPFSNLIDKTKKKKRVLLFYFDTKYIRIQTFAKGMTQSTYGEELIIKVSLIVYRAKIRTVLEDFFYIAPFNNSL